MKALTSLAPKNLDTQLKAVETWKSLGFEVFSFNIQKDIDLIGQVEDIILVESDPNLLEILYYCCQQDEPTWIINPHTSLQVDAESILKIQKKSKESLVFGSSVEGETVNLKNFDWFVIHKNHKYIINSRQKFYIDKPLWDHWLPLTFIKKNLLPILCKDFISYQHVEHRGLVSGIEYVETMEQEKKDTIEFSKRLIKDMGLSLHSEEESLLSITDFTLEKIYKESKIWLV